MKAYDRSMLAAIAERRSALHELCARFHVRRLDIFGSAARGDFDPASSDIDFLVEFQALPAVAYADAYFALLEELEALFGRPVNLLTSDAVVNPYLKASLDASRECVYAA